MDFLGIGPLELFFILLIVLIIFGPNDIVKAARTMGRFMRNIVTSDAWKAFQQASKGMKDLPTTLMREAGLEEDDLREMTGLKDLQEATKEFDNQISPWTTPPKPANMPVPPAGVPSAEADAPVAPQSTPQTEQEKPPAPAAPPADSPFSQNIDD